MERWYHGPRWALQVYWKASLHINTQFPLSAPETMTAVYKVHVTCLLVCCIIALTLPTVLFWSCYWNSHDAALPWNRNCAPLYRKLKRRTCGGFVFALSFFSCTFPPCPPRGRRGRNAATLRQAPWPCCFIILLTVVLKVLKYWTEHERWWPLSLPSLVVLFKVKDSDSHASAARLFRLTPRTITPVKEEEICVFTCDKCTLHTALSVLSKSLSHM